jgi:hypothetical protein
MDEGQSIVSLRLGASKATPCLAFIAIVQSLCEWGATELIETVQLERDGEVEMWHASIVVGDG